MSEQGLNSVFFFLYHRVPTHCKDKKAGFLLLRGNRNSSYHVENIVLYCPVNLLLFSSRILHNLSFLHQKTIHPQVSHPAEIKLIYLSLLNSNYRGITVSSCFGKLFSVILNSRIVTFLNKNNILNPAQIYEDYRTADHVFALKTILNTYKAKRKLIYACFMDFRKAFDNVWRYGMFVKLVRFGLSLKVLKLLLSMYSQLRSCVKAGQNNKSL